MASATIVNSGPLGPDRLRLTAAASRCRPARAIAGTELGGELSRSEVSLLSTLSGGPRRITELAELEGLAQPTTTSLVKALEQQGLARRDRQADDGRVVLVHLTDDGAGALEDYRARARELLGRYLAEIPDEQVEALAEAAEAVSQLVALLQRRHLR